MKSPFALGSPFALLALFSLFALFALRARNARYGPLFDPFFPVETVQNTSDYPEFSGRRAIGQIVQLFRRPANFKALAL